VEIRIVGDMPDRTARNAYPALSARLHDAATGFAIGLSLLKGATGSNSSQALHILDESLGSLKRLSQGVASAARPWSPQPRIESALARQAEVLGLDLELDLTGRTEWLPPNQSELLRLVIREALRNVRRHSGSKRCRVKLDLTSCPFVLQIRDWGSGILSGTRPSSGIALLQSLAAEIGCQLSLSSQPGLGTDLLLVGPACACEEKTARLGVREQRSARSQDAEKTPQDANKSPVDAQLRTENSRSDR
jgi:signal transduction histidine kinase